MWKDQKLNKFINIIFSVIGSILIFQDLYTYFFLKPTSMEESSISISVQHMPQIIFCPEPSFRIYDLQNMGFKGNNYS